MGKAPTSVIKVFNQSTCQPVWKKAVNRILYDGDNGCLNCRACGDLSTVELSALIDSFLKYAMDMKNLNLPLFVGVGSFALVIFLELLNVCTSAMGQGYVGRSLPTPLSHKVQYTLFWLFLFILKSYISYTVIVKPLVEASLFIWFFPNRISLPAYHFFFTYNFHNLAYILALWLPSWTVFMYDFQIWYALCTLVLGAVRGFNARIGDIRSFQLLRSKFDFLSEQFLQKCVGTYNPEAGGAAKKKKGKRGEGGKESGTKQRIISENVPLEGGTVPIMMQAIRYTSFYGNMSALEEGTAEPPASSPSSVSNAGGISGAEFERVVPFALAWNRVLLIMRQEDVISDRELAVLRYLIDSPGSKQRSLYAPAFLVAGKLDEALKIVREGAEVYKALKENKSGEKKLQKVDKAMKERLLKDNLRIYSIKSSYYTAAAALRAILGKNHKEVNQVFEYVEAQAASSSTMSGLQLSSLPPLREALIHLMRSLLDISLLADEVGNHGDKFRKLMFGVAEKAENVFSALRKVVSPSAEMVQLLDKSQMKENSFFFPKSSDGAREYCSQQIDLCISSEAVMDLISRTFYLLSVDNLDAEPKSREGKRRLRFFSNSLFMDMPTAKLIKYMHSISVATPYYAETALYSAKELTEFNEDHVNTLFYLQTVYPEEWRNFLERIEAKDGPSALKKNDIETRLWASYRGQTLARTVRGMLYMAEAVRFLYWLEIGNDEEMHKESCNCNLCLRLDQMVALKFSFVVTCQIYGKQKEKGQQQAADIDFLLQKHPLLRVAYVDEVSAKKGGAGGGGHGPSTFYSVLIKAVDHRIVEVYRVELPGNPIVGEGKPENTNHAIIFSRGEFVQAIDMNQDGYFEEWLKMPNLLRVTDDRPLDKQITIIGYREYVFTGAVSALAEFMSVQELAFVSLGQRILAMFLVRMHYGHPDIFDKLFAIGNGGTAKASKLINLSEDIFAGFNTTLRGGQVVHEEFLQCGKGRDVGMQQLSLFEAKLASGAGEVVISRDVARIGSGFDFFRLNSFFYGNIGWYITQTLTVVAIYCFIYCRLYMAFSGLEPIMLQYGTLGVAGTMNVEWAFQFGFLLAIPIIAVIGVEQGFRHGLVYLIWNTLSMGPLYFTFQMGTKMHYFDRTLLFGGAKYRATGRGFTIKHESFAELFRFYAFSHFYRGMELVFLLVLGAIFFNTSWCGCLWTVDAQYFGNIEPTAEQWNVRCYEAWYQQCVLPTNQNYGLMTFALWLIAASWSWAPFFFNPHGLDWEKLVADYHDFEAWLERENETSSSWLGWWLSETEYLNYATRTAKIATILRKTRFLFLAWCLWYDVAWYLAQTNNWTLIDPKTQWDNEKIQVAFYYGYLFLAALVIFMLALIYLGYLASRITKKLTLKQKSLRKLKFGAFFLFLVLVIVALFFIPVWGLVNIATCVVLVAYFVLQVLVVTCKTQHVVTRWLARNFDRFLAWLILIPLAALSMFLQMVGEFQKRIMFNNEFSASFDVARMMGRENVQRELIGKSEALKPKEVTQRYQLKKNKKQL